MKGRRILMIFVVFLGLMVWASEVAEAEPVGTAFSYQGWLMDKNNPAEGEYDFEFRVFDDPNAGTQQGSTIDVSDLYVEDGHFTVELDFGGGIFTGDRRWLETTVREGASNDPCDFVTLSPRQELTPTPYAIYAKAAGSDNDWMVSGDDMYSVPSGNVGIGTTEPDEKLHIAGKVKIVDGTEGNGKVLTSDANGVGSWQALPGSGVPPGVIVMWAGAIGDIPTDWVLCDGTNGNPDLRDKFIIGAGSSYSVGATGGSSTHSHSAGSYTASSHTHSFSGTTSGPSSTYCCICSCGTDPAAGHTHTHTYSGTTSSGGGGSITGVSAAASNLPPYYALAYIMYKPE